MRTKLTIILFLISACGVYALHKSPGTPAEVVSLIKKNFTCSWADKTVDSFKTGNSGIELKGIAECMFADMEILRKAEIENS